MTKDDCLAVLDIGTAKTVAFVLDVGHQAKPCVIGSGLASTVGLHKCRVVDAEGLTTSLRTALHQAEQNAGCRVNRLFCNTAGAPVSVLINQGTTAIGQKSKEIGLDDINRVIEASKILPHNSEQELVYAAPQRFYIDGRPVQEVSGKRGVRLDVETCVVTVNAENLADLAEIITNASMASLSGWIYNGMAIAASILTEEEQSSQVLIMDLGAGVVDITLVEGQQAVFAFALPIAGRHITNDLSIGLGINFDEAEQLKIQYGVASGELANPRIVVEFTGSESQNRVSQKVLAEIIEARLQEILFLIKQYVLQAGHQIPPYVVLTGGTAMLPGVDKLLKAMWGSKTRIANPPYIDGMPVNFNNPAYASSVAMSSYVARLNMLTEKTEKRFLGGIFEKFTGFWKVFSGT